MFAKHETGRVIDVEMRQQETLDQGRELARVFAEFSTARIELAEHGIGRALDELGRTAGVDHRGSGRTGRRLRVQGRRQQRERRRSEAGCGEAGCGEECAADAQQDRAHHGFS